MDAIRKVSLERDKSLDGILHFCSGILIFDLFEILEPGFSIPLGFGRWDLGFVIIA
jgi:hypothetical protein